MGLQILRSPVRFRLRPETALFFFILCARACVRSSGPEQNLRHVPVAQLDKASDYESGDWGFKSLQGYFLPPPTGAGRCPLGTVFFAPTNFCGGVLFFPTVERQKKHAGARLNQSERWLNAYKEKDTHAEDQTRDLLRLKQAS